MAYRFKLETLVNFRRNVEEQCRLRLARELAVLDQYRQRLKELQAERVRVIDELEAAKRKPLPVGEYRFFLEAIGFAETEIVRQAGRITAQEEAIIGVRQDLLQKMKDRKVIEKVREKDRLAYERETRKKEEKEGDEQVLLRFGRPAGRV